MARSNSRRTGTVAASLVPLTPTLPPRSVFLRLHTPAFTRPAAPRPKTSSFSVSVSSLTHGIPAVLRWPVRGWSGRRAAGFRGTRNPRGGGLPRLGLPSGARVEGGGAFAYLGAVRIGSGIFTWIFALLKKWCLVGRSGGRLFGSRGARRCVDFSDGGWDLRLGFSSLVWLVDGRKMQCWDWFEMFHMFIHICVYVFFFWYLCLALTHTPTDRSPSRYRTI